MDTNSFLVPSEQEVLTRSLYVHTFINSPNSESGRKILDSDHLLMALTNRFLFATILINNTNTFVLLDRFHRFHTISTDAFLTLTLKNRRTHHEHCSIVKRQLQPLTFEHFGFQFSHIRCMQS